MPWARMLAYVTGTVNQALLLRNENRAEVTTVTALLETAGEKTCSLAISAG